MRVRREHHFGPVAKPLSGDVNVFTALEGERYGGVAEVVQTNLLEARSDKHAAESGRERAGVYRPAELVAENDVVVLPQLPRGKPFLRLSRSMRLQRLDCTDINRDGA